MMALTNIEKVFVQARNASQEDVNKLCVALVDLLPLPDKTAECLNFLRQLYFVVQATQGEKSLSEETLVALLGVVRSAESAVSTKACLLAQALIAQLLPQDSSDPNCLNLLEEEAPVHKGYLPLYLLQGRRQYCLERALPTVTRWLTAPDLDLQRAALGFMTHVAVLHTSLLNQDVTQRCSERMAHWLSNASTQQAPNPYSLNPFRKDEERSVSEIDGTSCLNFFTLLNIGQYYTQDQYLNIFVFSTLRKWLYHCHHDACLRLLESTSREGSASDTDARSLDARSVDSTFSSLSSRAPGSLVGRIVEYCFRVFTQCERKPKTAHDAELILACLAETVDILDLVCQLEPGQVPRIYQEVRRLYTRIAPDPLLAHIALRIIKFFLNHSAVVVHDASEAYEQFFSSLLSQRFTDPGLAFDTVTFILDNLETLCFKTNILINSFPNILRILAWFPQTFLSEFMQILPAFIAPSTALEVFHCLLELPCLTASLELQERLKGESTSSQAAAASEPVSSSEAFLSAQHRPLFNFLLRTQGGLGDTINKLDKVHAILTDMACSFRVRTCSQTVPVLLKVWFRVVQAGMDAEFGALLLPVLLERSNLLYCVPEFQTDVKRILADQLLVMLKNHPTIVVDQRREISEFLTSLRNINGRVDLYANLVWAVGEFCSVHYCGRCSAEVIMQYYEMLEALVYELSSLLAVGDTDVTPSPKIVSVLISAIAKLSTRCQDLIPRAILCLSKVAKQSFSLAMEPQAADAVSSRAYQLLNLLKVPNFAATILNPPAEINSGRWHQDNMSIPMLMRGMYKLLSRTSPSDVSLGKTAAEEDVSPVTEAASTAVQ